MAEIDPDLTIRPYQRKDGTWCARATPSYGPAEDVGDFKSEAEVQDWIIHKARERFPKRGDSDE
jgi:hypothetical protein